jgi:hypothetical protein
MVLRNVSRLFTGHHGPLDGVLETAPLAVAEERLQISGAPVLGTIIIYLLDPFKRSIPLYRQAVI